MIRAYIKFIGGLCNTNHFKIEFCNEYPERIDANALYIMGESKYFWSILLRCPCGCGDILQLNLHRDTHPFWDMKFHINGSLSISPSVWKKDGCRSHFFIKRSNIIWARGIQKNESYKDRI